jgi:hypothetical protein
MVSAIARTIPTVPGFGAMLVPSWLQVCRIFIGNNQRRCVSYFTTSLVFQKRCKSMVGSVKKAPLCWRGQGDSHAARAAGWYPAPAHIPNSGRWNWFQMVVRLRLFLGRFRLAPEIRIRFGGGGQKKQGFVARSDGKKARFCCSESLLAGTQHNALPANTLT